MDGYKQLFSYSLNKPIKLIIPEKAEQFTTTGWLLVNAQAGPTSDNILSFFNRD